MAAYVLTEEQLKKFEMYNKYGWPPILYKEELVIYFRRQWGTIEKEYFNRPDSPIRKVAGIWSAPFKDLEGFVSAFYTGQIYKGLKSAEFEQEE